MKRQKDPTTVGLYVRTERDRDYFHVFATAVTIGLTAWDRRLIDAGSTTDVRPDTIRNFRDELFNGMWLNHLTAVSQGSNTDTTRHLYGFGLEYRNLFSVDSREAKNMAKTLASIEQRMARLATRYGAPATFGAYLARVAAAVGATRFVFPRAGAVDAFRPGDHTVVAVDDGIYRVDGLVRAWVQEQEKERVEA
jgi:hypothetical protein